MYITSAGNVGIGTTTPTAKLHVKGTGATSATKALLVENSAGTDLLSVYDNNQTNVKKYLRVGSDRLTYQGLHEPLTAIEGSVSTYTSLLHITDNHSAQVKTAGLSINVTSAGAGVEVRNNTTTRSTATGAGYAASTDGSRFGYFASSTLTATGTQSVQTNGFRNHMYFQATGGSLTATAHHMAYESGGQIAVSTVGISNVSDYAALGWSGTSNGTITNRYGLNIGFTSTGITNAWGVYQSSNTLKNFFAGNIGIGTTAPLSALDIQAGAISLKNGGNNFGSIDFYSMTTGVGMGASIEGVRGANWISGQLVFKTGEGTGNVAERMRITGYGKVGIGTTSPSQKLVVIGNVGFGDAYNGGVYPNSTTSAADTNWGLEVQRTGSSDDYNTRLKYYPVTGTARKAGIYNARSNSFSLYSDQNNTPNIIIPNGNVGIGTTNPTVKLDVNGAANISGAATMSGPTKMVGLSQHANDVAAGNAGLQTGDLYYSVSGGDRIIKMKI
tara:strand:+ start:28 stop:1527 length:1500 start_codon:yes stop_codon:yes gene_type:complete